MREKEQSFGEGVKEAWYFLVDDLLPMFFVGTLLFGAIMGLALLVAWVFGL